MPLTVIRVESGPEMATFDARPTLMPEGYFERYQTRSTGRVQNLTPGTIIFRSGRQFSFFDAVAMDVMRFIAKPIPVNP